MVKVMPTAKAATIPPNPTLQPIELPTRFVWEHPEQDVIKEIADAAKMTISPYQITRLVISRFIIAYIVISCLWKHCWHASFFYRSLFPMLKWSKFHRGTPTMEIVLKIWEIQTNKALLVGL